MEGRWMKKEGEDLNGGMASPRVVTLSTTMYQVPGKRQANWQNGTSPVMQADELSSFFNWLTEASEVRANPE